MDDSVLVPLRAYDLIDMLDKAYPHRCKRLGEDEAEHQRYAGVRGLIDDLLGLKDEQENNGGP